MDEMDRAIVNLLQDGMPICARPFREAGDRLGVDEQELIDRLSALLDRGVLSRLGPMFDAERLGGAFTLCAMQVPARRFEEVAATVNELDEVAHNYERDHAYNMWFVLAAQSTTAIEAAIAAIEAATGLTVLDLPKQEEFFVRLRLEA